MKPNHSYAIKIEQQRQQWCIFFANCIISDTKLWQKLRNEMVMMTVRESKEKKNTTQSKCTHKKHKNNVIYWSNICFDLQFMYTLFYTQQMSKKKQKKIRVLELNGKKSNEK